MSLDANLLGQAEAAEARVIDAEHEAEVARADFHRAVRRLQLAGGSLREIAGALNLSHQRVHQIVEAAGARALAPAPDRRRKASALLVLRTGPETREDPHCRAGCLHLR